jgi:DNA-directed RNA polymerase subunit E"
MKKACNKCKILFSEEKCPICNNTDFSEMWKGRIIVLKPAESEIAKKLGIEREGIYAIKIK